MTFSASARDEKRGWEVPTIRRIRAGSAESTHNANSDGGGGNQGS
jgi:hypothetical protein